MKLLQSENNKGRILMLVGESRYNVLTTAMNQVAAGFNSRGYDVCILDLMQSEDEDYFARHLSDDWMFAFALQAVAFERRNPEGILYSQLMKYPFVGWIFDDFILHWQRSQYCIGDNTFLLSVDGRAASYAGFLKNINKHLLYMPHGCFDFGVASAQKDIDVLIPGTFGKLPTVDSLSDCPEEDINLAVNIIETVLANPHMSVRQAIKKLVPELNEELLDYVLLQKYAMFEFVLEYIRVYFRNVIIANLVKSGINIHMVGDDSSGTSYPPNVHMHGRVDIEEVSALMDRAKVVINPIPNVYEGGFHERIFMAFKSRAILFTPFTPYLEKELGSRVDFVDLNNLEDFIRNVRMAISEYENYYEAINDNYEFAMQNHTFEKRGEQIIEMFEAGTFDFDRKN